MALDRHLRLRRFRNGDRHASCALQRYEVQSSSNFCATYRQIFHALNDFGRARTRPFPRLCKNAAAALHIGDLSAFDARQCRTAETNLHTQILPSPPISKPRPPRHPSLNPRQRSVLATSSRLRSRCLSSGRFQPAQISVFNIVLRCFYCGKFMEALRAIGRCLASVNLLLTQNFLPVSPNRSLMALLVGIANKKRQFRFRRK